MRGTGRVWLAVCALALTSAACTVIRYEEGGEGGGGGGTPPPRVLDALVLTHVDASTPNLAASYEAMLEQLVEALALQNVQVRHAALAPLHRRAGAVVPLLFAPDDPDPELFGFAEAMTFFASDENAALLDTRSAAEGENLATLGAALATQPLFHPGRADVEGEPYFEAPADGFVALVLSSAPRPCAADSAACEIAGEAPADYFGASAGGVATWLQLPGGGLPLESILHVHVVTAEGVDYATFHSRCMQQPEMPAGLLDVMQPSASRYYGPLTAALEEAGGRAFVLDMCEALSASGPRELLGLSQRMAAAL